MSKIVRFSYETVCLQDPALALAGAYQAVYDQFKARLVRTCNAAYGIVKTIVGTGSISPTGVPLSLQPNLIIWNGGPAASIDLGNITPLYGGSTVSVGYGISANQIVTIPGNWFNSNSTLSFSQPNAAAIPYPTATNIALLWYV